MIILNFNILYHNIISRYISRNTKYIIIKMCTTQNNTYLNKDNRKKETENR